MCQPDKSAVATVAKTKEPKKAFMGPTEGFVFFCQFWKPSPV